MHKMWEISLSLQLRGADVQKNERDLSLFVMSYSGFYGKSGTRDSFRRDRAQLQGQWKTLNQWCMFGLNVEVIVLFEIRMTGIFLHSPLYNCLHVLLVWPSFLGVSRLFNSHFSNQNKS